MNSGWVFSPTTSRPRRGPGHRSLDTSKNSRNSPFASTETAMVIFVDVASLMVTTIKKYVLHLKNKEICSSHKGYRGMTTWMCRKHDALSPHIGIACTCRVQNTDIPRAGRVGVHGGAAGRGRAGLDTDRTVRPGDTRPSYLPRHRRDVA